MAQYLGLEAVGWQAMKKNWWQLVTAVIILASIILGSLFGLFAIYRKAQKYWRGRGHFSAVPPAVNRYLDGLKSTSQPLRRQRVDAEKPSSFGVFLGNFDATPTLDQTRILSQWDLIVLDPLRDGVLDAVSSQCTSKHILGRLDVGLILQSKGSLESRDLIRSLENVTTALLTSFKRPQDTQSPFNGVLLADWQTHIQPVIFNALITFIHGSGLDVYLEVSSPSVHGETQYRDVDMEVIKGIVCRNGSILPSGDRRNYFQLADMRPALRNLVATSSRDPIIMMWETLDDDVEMIPSVIKRSFTWCKFYNAISWIGPQAALVDAEIAVTKTVTKEPSAALMWLKRDAVMKAHEIWRFNDQISQTACGDHAIYDSLQSFIPDLRARLSLPSRIEERVESSVPTMINGLDGNSPINCTQENPFSSSPRGCDYTGLGCFPIGLDCLSADFENQVRTQCRLRDLNLLRLVETKELRRIGEQLFGLDDTHSSWAGRPDEAGAVKELLYALTADNDEHNGLRVYIGLDTGFRTDSDAQFWGLYDVDPQSGSTDLFLSGKAQDLPGTILHTFMSSRNCTRAQCFLAESFLSEQTGNLNERWQLPPRLLQDLEMLTPTESILFMQHLQRSNCEECPALSEKVRARCEYQLMEVPSLEQLRALNATAYLRGEISAEDLVDSRLAWYGERGCQHPDPAAAVSLFNAIDARMPGMLLSGQIDLFAELADVIQTVLEKNRIDASADLFALSVFCSIRKLALEDVYLEIMDRNPLPNSQPDQAACFAEMFALGSRCESYFGMTSNALGRILSDKSTAYYKVHEPPSPEDGFTELPTAYASTQIDLDPNAALPEVPIYYKITFLGVFAVPALIDILLLTTTGRGLYLTAYMSQIEKSMATVALMSSLLVCGTIGTWIGSGGSYYLYSMAFSAMNMFVLSRFIAGLALTLGGGVLAFIIIGFVKGLYAGLVFFLYFFLLSTYLTLLAALSIYQFPGFVFQSGRLAIMRCLPILFISPIVTLWVPGYDILIYLLVITALLVSLLFETRQAVSEWGTWYHKIPRITDNDVTNWSDEIRTPSDSRFALLEGSTAVQLPRQALLAAVLKERNRRPWTKPTTDKLVLQLAEGYSCTIFLLDWYCKYTRTQMPYPYSSTWNLTIRAATETLRDLQKGVKLHNAFVHWRHAGDEVWCGVIYFLIALLDKWVAMLSGGSIVGLSAATDETFRLAVGFGLAYYLIGAVVLDTVSQPLWQLAHKTLPQPIRSMEFLQEAAKKDAEAKRKLYWTSLAKFFFIHIWGLSATAALMWIFDNSRDATVMFLAYMMAYTGLLWYQFNRIFTGSLAMKDLLIALCIGFPTGLLLTHFVPRFAYSSVIALATAAWTAAILSIWTSNIRVPKFKEEISLIPTPDDRFHDAIGPHSQLSQKALSETFDSICSLSDDFRYKLDPLTHPGVEVMAILLSRSDACYPKLVRDAFRSRRDMIHWTAELWKRGETVVELVSARHFAQRDQMTRVTSRTTGNQLHIFICVGLDLVEDEWIMDIRRNCNVIAEAIIHATAESKLGLSHEHSTLAELLAVTDKGEDALSIPEGRKRQLENSAVERARVIRTGEKEMLRYLLLGLDCDKDWDSLPRTVRAFLLQRCLKPWSVVSDDQLNWIESRFCHDSLDVDEYVARCNLGASLTVLVNSFAEALEAEHIYGSQQNLSHSSDDQCLELPFTPSTNNLDQSRLDLVKLPFYRIYYGLRICIKFLVVCLVADPEFQRELDYVMSTKYRIIRWPVTFVLNGFWIYCKTLQRVILPHFLLHGRQKVSKLYNDMKGTKTVIEKNRIVIESLNGISTAFLTPQSDGVFELRQYSGSHDQEPSDLKGIMAVNTYTDKLVLRQRREFAVNGSLANEFMYEDPNVQNGQQSKSKLALQRQCTEGALEGQMVQFDKTGHMTSGSYIKKDELVEFKYSYRRNAKFEDELLRAEYIFQDVSVRVSWSAPPTTHREMLDRWIPNSKVMEATFLQDSMVYHSTWDYDHKFHPTILTTLNGEEIETPSMIKDDWLDVLKKPTKCSILNDNPLSFFSSTSSSFISRLFRRNTRWYPISTSRARTFLWKSWKSGKEYDAVTARWLDEIALRSDRAMKPYWNARDTGRLQTAERFLSSQADTLMARVDVDPEVSMWTNLAFKLSDLSSFGQGGDSRINTRTQTTQLTDSDTQLHVLTSDTGTWPNEGGGVSACRRDMINNLHSIRWHIIAESASDFGVPKFQIEKNVHSLKVLPLWGLDFLTPTHGIFQDCLDSAVQQKAYDTMEQDIIQNFIPILTSLVKISRAIHIGPAQVEEATKALVDLNTYFESGRHWGTVWMSDQVKKAWRQLWLCEDMENATPLSKWLPAERPTLAHLDNALDMWHRYLLVFSVPVPEKIPDVFQASHHFTAASYGVVCKLKRNCSLHVWDHCISWREVTVFLSSAMSFDSPFVRTALISLSRMASVVILRHADAVLPCADFFNPGWEVEIGTGEGVLQHRRAFARRIDPVVNGIPDVHKFKPIETIKSKRPTATMLSHIRYVKDIKNAILAAEIIVNQWGFTDYQLDIYGDMEKAASYSVECQELIASRSLGNNVALKGLGDPTKVLEDTWIFLNSSISEGLPLALGEAALTGAPVVCTDVGASLRVFQDPSNGKRYGSVVPPNDVVSLARGQVSMLALLEEFSEFAEDKKGYRASLPPNPSKEEVQQIQQRIYDKTPQRRALGMLSRSLVLQSFSPERYLREHEQMLWIGKYQSKSHRARVQAQRSAPSSERSTLRLPYRMSKLRPSTVNSYRGSSGTSTLRDSALRSFRDSSGISTLRNSTLRSFRDSSGISTLRNSTAPSFQNFSGVPSLRDSTARSFQNFSGVPSLRDSTARSFQNSSAVPSLRESTARSVQNSSEMSSLRDFGGP